MQSILMNDTILENFIHSLYLNVKPESYPYGVMMTQFINERSRFKIVDAFMFILKHPRFDLELLKHKRLLSQQN
jgi:hypothetical protein